LAQRSAALHATGRVQAGLATRHSASTTLAATYVMRPTLVFDAYFVFTSAKAD